MSGIYTDTVGALEDFEQMVGRTFTKERLFEILTFAATARIENPSTDDPKKAVLSSLLSIIAAYENEDLHILLHLPGANSEALLFTIVERSFPRLAEEIRKEEAHVNQAD